MATNDIRVLSLGDYVAIFRAHRLLIIASVAAVLAIAILFSALATPLYRAEARVRVDATNSELVTEGTGIATSIRDRNLQNEVDFAGSDRVVDLALEDLAENELNADVSPSASSDRLIFSAVDADPERAAEIANVWSEAFVSERAASDSERFNTSLEVIDTRLAEIAEERAELEDSTDDEATIASQLSALDRAEEGLRQQLNDIDVLIELNQGGTVSVLNAAVAPDSPFSPNWPLNIALGLIAGALLGLGLALAREALDDTIREPDDLRRALDDLPTLASVPNNRKGRTDSPGFTEAIRTLQLGIEFSKSSNTRLNSVLVTSPNASEGKSTIASQLALTYARSGSSVLLVDADMHNPTQATTFEISNTPGLAEHLEGRDKAKVVRVDPGDGSMNLAVLPAGLPGKPPSQTLSSNDTVALLGLLSDAYDMVIIDSPPLLPVADSRSLARHTDATIIVTRNDETSAKDVERAIELLDQVRVAPLGGVLNGYDQRNNSYYGSANNFDVPEIDLRSGQEPKAKIGGFSRRR